MFHLILLIQFHLHERAKKYAGDWDDFVLDKLVEDCFKLLFVFLLNEIVEKLQAVVLQNEVNSSIIIFLQSGIFRFLDYIEGI
jgi:hypothetical protein